MKCIRFLVSWRKNRSGRPLADVTQNRCSSYQYVLQIKNTTDNDPSGLRRRDSGINLSPRAPVGSDFSTRFQHRVKTRVILDRKTFVQPRVVPDVVTVLRRSLFIINTFTIRPNQLSSFAVRRTVSLPWNLFEAFTDEDPRIRAQSRRRTC